MPTVLQVGSYSFDRPEPPHIHIKRDRLLVKFWLDPVVQDKNRGFKAHELSAIAKLVEENRENFLEAWNDYFDVGS